MGRSTRSPFELGYLIAVFSAADPGVSGANHSESDCKKKKPAADASVAGFLYLQLSAPVQGGALPITTPSESKETPSIS